MNKRNLLKLTILTFLLFLLIGCEMDLKNLDSSDKTASVTLEITGAKALRTILPEETEINSYTVTLQNKSKGDVQYNQNFSKDEEIEIESVLVGTYTVTVDGYSDDYNTTKVATGEAELTVTADGANNACVTLSWLDEGTGSFSLTINWADLTKEDNIIYKAIEKGSLGFQAWDKDKNLPYEGAEIQWVKDFTKKEFTYTQSGISKGETNISMRVYSKIDDGDQVIAETFYTSVTIYVNITSYPDGNETFSLNNDNIVYYLKNVTNVKADLNSEDSGHKIDISWEYPSLNDGSYRLEVWLTKSNDASVVGEKKIVNYTVKNEKSSGVTSLTFSGLEPGTTYSVHLINYTNDTGHVYSYSAEIIPLQDIKTKVKVESINFTSDFATSYLMGESVTLGANITPYDATNKEYTVTASNGATVSDKTVSFPSSGDYTITLTSVDDEEKSASETVTVSLVAPEDFTLKKTAEGMQLDWDIVESATAYTIEKSYNRQTETLTSSSNSYTDKDVRTAIEYTYRVKAVREDSKFDSAYTEEKKETITNSLITVTVPRYVTSETFKPILEAALEGRYVTDLKGITVTIDTSESTLLSSSSTTFKWLLNGRQIGETNSKSVEINKNNVNINSSESTNTLQLIATNGDTTYSASTYVHYIEVDPGKVTIQVPENTSYIDGQVKVVYGSPVSLTAKTENYDKAIILWSSSDPSIASVDSGGVVTSLLDGSVDITATIVATGVSDTIKVKSYIPVKSVSFDTSKLSREFILAKFNLSGNGSSYTSLDLRNAVCYVGENNKEPSTEAKDLIWSCTTATISDGIITSSDKGEGGTANITLRVNNSDAVATLSIPVYRFEIYDDQYNKKTDSTIEIKYTVVWSKTNLFALSSSKEYINGFKYSWSMDSSVGLQEIENKDAYNPTIKLASNGKNLYIYVTIYYGETEVVKLKTQRTS